MGEAAAYTTDDGEPALVNGMVARVMLSSFFDFAELSDLITVPIEDVRSPLRYIDPNH